MRVKRYTRLLREALLPGLDQRLGLGLVGAHDQVSALARFAHIVGAQRKTDPLGRTAPALQAQVTPPSAIVVPNVMVRPVFTVRQSNKFVLYDDRIQLNLIQTGKRTTTTSSLRVLCRASTEFHGYSNPRWLGDSIERVLWHCNLNLRRISVVPRRKRGHLPTLV